MSLGAYNLAGGVVLIAAGVLLLVAATYGLRRPALAAAGLTAVAGLSLHAQLGFTDPLLGGTPTSAAYLFCLTVVGAFLAWSGGGTDATAPSPHSTDPTGRTPSETS